MNPTNINAFYGDVDDKLKDAENALSQLRRSYETLKVKHAEVSVPVVEPAAEGPGVEPEVPTPEVPAPEVSEAK